MARRRKKHRKRPLRPRPTMPTVYDCPHCGARMISITIDKKRVDESGNVLAIIRCGKCGLYAEMYVPKIFQPVDVYSKFLDAYHEGTLKYTFIKLTESIEGEEEGIGRETSEGLAEEEG